MKYNLIAGILALAMFSIAGCGNQNAATGTADSLAKQTESQAEPQKVNSGEEGTGKKDAKEPEYEEKEDVFIAAVIDEGDGTLIDLSNAEWVGGPFTIDGSVDIYSPYGTKCGYTKPDITVDGINKLKDSRWLYVPFKETSCIIKAEDLGKFVATAKPENENQAASAEIGDTAQAGTANTQAQPQTPVQPAPATPQAPAQSQTPAQTQSVAPPEPTPQPVAPTPTPQPAEPAPAPATPAYSEAEVIAIYENALRAAGQKRTDEVMSAEDLAEFGPTDGMGWGIADIPMNDPYTYANADAQGARTGGYGVYYIENLGSSDGYVHLKVYRGTN